MWKRRRRIVAREYRTGNTDANQFSPTPAGFTMRLILVLGKFFNRCLFVADIKDVFLSVRQRELVEVIVPSWVRNLAHGEQADNPWLTAERWRLLKCLPGQKNATLRWSEHFKELVEKMNFESYKGMPKVFKHSTRKMFLMIHVDDVLGASGVEDWTWFSEIVRKQLTMNAEGSFQYGSNNTFYYLKKKVVLARQGIFVQPNPSYIKNQEDGRASYLSYMERRPNITAPQQPRGVRQGQHQRARTTQCGRPANVPIWFGAGTLHSARSTRYPTIFQDFVTLHGWRNKVGIHSFETPWKLSPRDTRCS